MTCAEICGKVSPGLSRNHQFKPIASRFRVTTTEIPVHARTG